MLQEMEQNHAFGTGTARWIQIICPAANSAVVRLGDVNISATQGLPIAAGGGMLYPPLPANPIIRGSNQLYDLSTLYYRAASGDKVSIVWSK